MLDVANLGFRIDSSQLVTATGHLRQFGAVSDQTAALVNRAKAAFAALGVSLSIGAFVQAADSYREMSNTLKVLGNDTQQAADRISQLADMAARTRTPLAATVDLYQRTSIAARELGASQEQVMRFTENVGLALAQQGGSAAAASGALMQLGQALAGGTVRAEEFNSMMEGAYPLVLAAAQGIDGAAGSVGRLRNMVIEGEVSSREFFDAIMSQSSALEAAFGNTVPTVGQAMQVLRDSVVLAAGAFDTASGASSGFASAILSVAKGLNTVGSYLSTHADMVQRLTSYAMAAGTAYGTALAAGLTATAIAAVRAAGAMTLLSKAMVLTGWGAVVVLLGEVINKFRELSAGVGGIGNLFGHFKAVATEAADRVGYAFQSLVQSANALRLSIVSAAAGAAAGLVGNVVKGVNLAVGAFVGAVNAIGAAWASLPAVVGQGVKAAVNGVISAVEAMVNAAIGGVNKVVEGINGILAVAGMEGIATLGTVAIARFEADFGGAAADAGAAIGGAFSAAMGQEYVSSGWTDTLNSVSATYQDAAASANEAGAAYGRMASAQMSSVAALQGAYQKGRAEMDAAAQAAKGTTSAVQQIGAAAGAAGDEAEKAGGKGKKGAKEAKDATKDLLAELNRELDAREALIGLYGEERQRIESLQQVHSKLGDDIGKYSQSAIQATADRIVAVDKETKAWEDHVNRIDGLTDDLASAWGDWIAGGLRDFKDFVGNILKSFQRMISEMIATAAANPIRLAITGAMGGMPGAAAAGVPGGGMLSGILGSWKGGTGLLGGAGSVIGGLMNGGIGGAIKGLSTALSGGLTTAIGGLIPVVGAAAAVFSFFKSKTKELDRGLRVTVDGMDTLVETFRRTEKSRFWGLRKKRRTSYDEADAATADPIEAYVAKMQTGVLDAAKALGVGAEAFKDFSAKVKISTKGLTDEQVMEEIQRQLGALGDNFAALVPGLTAFSQEGEGALATLDRLTNTIGVVNGALGGLGLTLYDMSVNGAGAAAAFADLFGGLDQFAQASSAYYEAFYSDAERFARLQEVSNKAIRDAGLAVPATREAYRRLVEAQNLSTEAGRKAAAVLLQLAPAFDQIFGKMEEAAGQTREAALNAAAAAREALDSSIQYRAELIQDSFTDAQRAMQAQGRMRQVFAELGVAIPETAGAYRDLLRSLDLTTESGRAAMASIGAVGQTLLDTFDAAARAATSAADAARQTIADANASRADLLNSLLTDQQRAAQAQAEIAATFAALNLQVPTTLDGLRAIIAGLDLTGEAGRKALAQIAGIADALKEKLTPVTQAAERDTSGGSSGLDNAASEREQLERQLLQLQGNVTELRRRELAALDPANRALQKMVWRLEDAKAAMDGLNTSAFSTLVDYELARAKAANVNTAPAAEDRKAQEARQARDSAVLLEMRDYMLAVVNNTHRAARETRDLRMIQEGGVA